MSRAAGWDRKGLLRTRWVRFVVASALGAALLTVAAPASADAIFTIGDFVYDTSPFFGPDFTIINNSEQALSSDGSTFKDLSGTFTDLTLTLFQADATGTEVQVYQTALDPIAAGQNPDTSTLGIPPLPASFDSASLSLTFSGGALDAPTPVSLSGIAFSQDVTGAFTGTGPSDAFIHFTPATSPVPEPSTLLLVGAGTLVAAVRRRKRR